jgi:hypothetical protein
LTRQGPEQLRFGQLALVVSRAMWLATSRLKVIGSDYSSIISNDVEAMRAVLVIDSRIQNFSRLAWQIIAHIAPLGW